MRLAFLTCQAKIFGGRNFHDLAFDRENRENFPLYGINVCVFLLPNSNRCSLTLHKNKKRMIISISSVSNQLTLCKYYNIIQPEYIHIFYGINY